MSSNLIPFPKREAAELIADAVVALANGRGLASARAAQLRARRMLERRRVIRIARRIHEAGLDHRRPGEGEEPSRVGRRQALRGKPGWPRRRFRG